MRCIFAFLVAISSSLILVAQPVRSDTMAILPLEVISADKEHVALRWGTGELKASEFVVERRSGVDSTMRTIARTTQLVFVDKTIDPLETYTYRIRIFADNGRNLGVTEERIVGPPPMGFSNVLKMGNSRPSQFGWHLSMCLDENDDPAFACLLEFNQGLDTSRRQLVFIRWSRSKYQWLDPVAVGTLFGVTESGLCEQISLCRDPASDVFYIAYRLNPSVINIGESRNGNEWNISQVDRSDLHIFDHPRVIALNDQLTVTYFVDSRMKIMRRFMKGKSFEEVKLDSRIDIEPSIKVSQIRPYINKNGVPYFAFFANIGNSLRLLHVDGKTGKLEEHSNDLPVNVCYTENFFASDSAVAIRTSASEKSSVASSRIVAWDGNTWSSVVNFDGWSCSQFDAPPNHFSVILAKLIHKTDNSIQRLAIVKADKNFVWNEYLPAPDFSFVSKVISEPRIRTLIDETIYCAFLNLDSSSTLMQGIVLYRGR